MEQIPWEKFIDLLMHNKGKLVTKLAYKLFDLSAVEKIVTYFLLKKSALRHTLPHTKNTFIQSFFTHV